jgi:ATP-dependent RNA helicase DDX47/RRP3
MVCQYDVELYQKIEELIGKKLPVFTAEEEEVLLLLEQVSEAQRLTTIHMREKDSTRKKGKRKGFGDDDDADHPASGSKRFKNQEKGKRPKKKSK